MVSTFRSVVLAVSVTISAAASFTVKFRETDRSTHYFATNASLTVGQRDEATGKYEADLTFTLAVMPDTESDDLLVHVVVGGAKVWEEKTGSPSSS